VPDVEIRSLTTADAQPLVNCFERCYGDTYPNDSFHDPAAIAELVRSGTLRSVVAVAADGRIVGHTGLTLRHPAATVTEAGNTVVDPEFRGAGILGRMGTVLADICTASGFVGYVHYPTAAHDVMQRHSVAGGGFETGVMLGYIPADTDYREIKQSVGRIAATIVYQPLAQAAQADVVIPDRYAPILGRLYGQMGLRRIRVAGSATKSGRSELTATFNTRRNLLNIQIEHVGADVAELVAQAILDHPADVTHVDLVLDEPCINQCVDDLAMRGFFFCGLLPGYARNDVLRVQHLRDQPASAFAPDLANAGARSLLEIIDAEQAPPV